MKYATRLSTDALRRAKKCHQIRAMLKRHTLAPCNCASGFPATCAAIKPSDYAAVLDDFQTKGGAR